MKFGDIKIRTKLFGSFIKEETEEADEKEADSANMTGYINKLTETSPSNVNKALKM